MDRICNGARISSIETKKKGSGELGTKQRVMGGTLGGMKSVLSIKHNHKGLGDGGTEA